MQIRAHKLVGIPVRTRSGKQVGRLNDVRLELDTGRIDALLVRSRGLIPGLLDQELCIAWSNVVSLSAEEAIVADGFLPLTGKRFAMRLPGAGLTEHA